MACLSAPAAVSSRSLYLCSGLSDAGSVGQLDSVYCAASATEWWYLESNVYIGLYADCGAYFAQSGRLLPATRRLLPAEAAVLLVHAT